MQTPAIEAQLSKKQQTFGHLQELLQINFMCFRKHSTFHWHLLRKIHSFTSRWVDKHLQKLLIHLELFDFSNSYVMCLKQNLDYWMQRMFWVLFEFYSYVRFMQKELMARGFSWIKLTCSIILLFTKGDT